MNNQTGLTDATDNLLREPGTEQLTGLGRLLMHPQTIQWAAGIDYARSDGGPLTDEDFDRPRELVRTASALPVPSEKVTIRCR